MSYTGMARNTEQDDRLLAPAATIIHLRWNDRTAPRLALSKQVTHEPPFSI